MYSQIKKRNGQVAIFNKEKITTAIAKAGEVTGEFDLGDVGNLAKKVIVCCEEVIDDEVPRVEQIQDVVEDVLLQSKFKKTAKAYILYREQHTQLRD
ncbi:Ribonucleotide reductase of class III (anaerobic), large subunit, partial [hydrothermal vent metagenome]